MAEKQTRIFLWAAPRTISTAFFRAMMNRSNITTLLEPYANAYYFGSERISKRYEQEPIAESATYADVRKQCEMPFSDHAEVFIKDMAYYLNGKLDTMEYIPKGYQHAILVRNPYRAVKSLFKLSTNREITGWNSFEPKEAGFEELYQLFSLVQRETGVTPVVVDADDLLNFPEKILGEFCKRTGLDFQESMLKWPSLEHEEEQAFKQWMPWFEGALTSEGFLRPPLRRLKRAPSEELPADVMKCIADSKHYYEQLCEYKIDPLV